MEENINCAICYLNEMETNENFIILDCGHIFHFFCLQEFYNISKFYDKRCCYCTKNLSYDDITLLTNYFNHLKQLNLQCICSNITFDFIKNNKEFLNSNNYKLYETCIMYNNYNNFNILFPYLNIGNNINVFHHSWTENEQNSFKNLIDKQVEFIDLDITTTDINYINIILVILIILIFSFIIYNLHK
jgi:hypothetical protein